MDIQHTNQPLNDVRCDALIVGAARTKTAQQSGNAVFSDAATTVDHLLDGLVSQVCAAGDFKGNLGEMLTLYSVGKLAARRVILIGLGAQEKIDTQVYRRASAVAARHAQKTGAQSIALALLMDSRSSDAAQQVQAEAEGTLLGTYTFRKYKHSEESGNGHSLSSVTIIAGSDHTRKLDAALARGTALAEATNFARDLINEPPNVMTPTELASRASAMASGLGLECEILDRPQMQELGMGGLLGVSQGSAELPKFIILRYRGAPQQGGGLALVGKGITFDTGGISIKPAAGMESMKGDMSGAAAVIGAMQAIATLKPAVNVTVLVSTTENMPGGGAYRPGDILRIMNGKTIEIVNTDAEGRLVLSDALSYAVKEGLSPIIDVATLTGGIVVALGNKMAGLFCNDDQLTQDIITAGKRAGEKFWRMPLDDDYAEQIESEIADIKQTGGRPASSVTAAKILENFVGDARWAHMDIAGMFLSDSQKPYQEKGAIGFAVRTLAELALQMAE